jgi:hypothetical protein
VCTANGEQRTRCWFNDAEDQGVEPRAHYEVDGEIATPALGGNAAITFLADKKIVAFTMRMWCH